MTNKQDLRQTVFLGILCAQGIILGIVEQSFPPIFAFAPGAKIGLTNIVTMIALLTLPFNDCIILTFLRVTLSALISGTLSTFIYAFLGAFLSLFAMKLFMIFYPRFMSIIGISIVGGIIHNLGQLIIASIVAQSWYIMLYLPVLAVMGIISGFMVGAASYYFLPYLNTFSFVKNKLFTSER
ncbi:heptaprenyl diphosphate synthase [Lactobacillus colini]|uniref:Heptaprenyl diphosphate synthase n=1 Tax=Lactobacillus colini TaxID=1819254 RepID=A0ABS4MDI2_9LACO|nr:Gx transporter family protein [Lactobacillus colini]MBP2057750.1 heptaprenyl diphosphate synthase [Lactobacillus colini]